MLVGIKTKGYGLIHVRQSGSSYSVSHDSYDQAYRDWMRGQAFVTAVGIFGEIVTIKCAEIEGMSKWTEECVATLNEQIKLEAFGND